MSTVGTYYEESTKFGGHLLATNTASNSTSLVFTSASGFASSLYNTYIFEMHSLQPATSEPYAHLTMRVSSNDGASWYDASYWWQIAELCSHAAPAYAGSVGGGTTQTAVFLQGSQLTDGLCGRVIFGCNPTSVNCRQFRWHTCGYSAGRGGVNSFGSGMCAAVGPINAVLFYYSPGINMIFGNIRLYGLTK